MRTRCISCQTEFDLSNALEKYDLKASSHDQICENKRCTKPGFGGSRFCKDHLSAWRDPNPLETDRPQLQKLREHVSPFLQVKWSDEPAMGKVLALMDSIGAGKSPVSALRFVDLEYNIFTGRVFEIGMCDAYGTKTMDCRTLYGSKALRAISQKSSTADCNMDRMMMKSVQAHHCTQGPKTAKQIADELRRQGISQETYFIVWHFHTDDLSRLRERLESEGECGILPRLPVHPIDPLLSEKPSRSQTTKQAVLVNLANHLSHHDVHGSRTGREEPPRPRGCAAAAVYDGHISGAMSVSSESSGRLVGAVPSGPFLTERAFARPCWSRSRKVLESGACYRSLGMRMLYLVAFGWQNLLGIDYFAPL